MSITPERDDSRNQPAGEATNVCPECQTINSRRAATCWLCFAPLRGDAPATRHYADSRAMDAHLARQARTARMTGVILALLVALAGIGILSMGDAVGVVYGLLFLAAAAPTLMHLFQPFGGTETAD